MLRDPAPLLPMSGSLERHLEHIEYMSEDVKSRPWPAVRMWSYHVFSEIEKKKLDWEDTQKIEQLRTRIQLSYSAKNSEAICRDFNREDCNKGDRHEAGGKVYRHHCFFCFKNLAYRNPHPEIRCENKKKIQQRRNQKHDYHNQNSQSQSNSEASTGNQPHMPQHAEQPRQFIPRKYPQVQNYQNNHHGNFPKNGNGV